MNKNHSVNSSNLKPQLLFSIPSSPNMKQSVLENTLQFSFPNGIDISYYEQRPKIYSILFTDRESNNYYYYILLFYEKINDYAKGSKSSSNRNSDINVSETYYCPISIIIWSDYGNIDFFRGLLINFYKIIKFDYSYLNNNNINNNIIMNGLKNSRNNGSINSNFDKDKILSFQKVELLNYFNFCFELPRPPNASIFSLNMRFDKVDYKFQSLLEIPTNDFCLDVLFNTLEISVIIKLFVALLFEKFIIIISNQNMPLFCICESLRYLLFPFEHSFVYIPNLPFDKKDILDSPVPYLIGINTSEISAEELINPYRIVCEVGTSTLYGNTSKLKLPLKEEMKIKSKLILLRSKYRNVYDNIEPNNSLNNKNLSKRSSKVFKEDEINADDDGVDFNLSFAQNVQNIFFSVFKNNMRNIREYIKNNNFNSQRFLSSFKNEEYKLFFDIIVKTSAFEIFINSMSFLDDCLSRKFNTICKSEYEINKEKKEQKNYYKYSFTIPKKLNKLFKISEFKEIYDEYSEISNLLEDNKNKNIKSPITINECSKCSYKSIKQQYCYLNFYGKDNFISFALDNRNNFFYKNIIKNEIIELYRVILKVYYDEENFLEKANKLIQDIRLTMTIKSNFKENKNSKDGSNEIIVNAPIKSCCQIYLLIAIFLHNTLKINNIDNKNIDALKKSNNSNISNNNKKKNNKEIMRACTVHSPSTFLSQFKYNNNKLCLEHLNTNNEKVIIDNIFIFKLFLFAFHKNKREFPRNLFFASLSKYSLEELKKIENTKIKYIDETVQCKIRELEKKAYKTPVIKMDSDIDDIDEESKNRKRIKNKYTNVKMNKRPNSCINFNEYKTVDNESDKEEEKKNNITKMKLNVVDSLNPSIDKINLNDLRNIYIQRRISQKINSWNVVNLANIPLLTNNSIGEGMSLKSINLKLDPMLISEQICIKLYLYLSKVKIENFDEKNDNTDIFVDLAHSNEITEIKDLILNLKNISLENLSKSPDHYYCFWLNMYNFLTVFSIIFKCEGFSNFYEWNRFIKNSYFTIGNIELSLLEIEAYILRDKSIMDKIYGIKKYDSQLGLPEIPKYDNLINFGISMATMSSPSIRIYYPTNFQESLKFNMNEFFYRNIKIDLDKIELKMPEYLTWIEPNFMENFNKYKIYLPEECTSFVEENKNNLNISVEKYYWKLSFANFKNSEINFW